MIETNRPLGAFISIWNDQSKKDLKKYGFIENGITKKIYQKKDVIIYKYKTQHTSDDNTGIPYLDEKNNYTDDTFHHLDFYIFNDKLINTDVYTSNKNNQNEQD